MHSRQWRKEIYFACHVNLADDLNIDELNLHIRANPSTQRVILRIPKHGTDFEKLKELERLQVDELDVCWEADPEDKKQALKEIILESLMNNHYLKRIGTNFEFDDALFGEKVSAYLDRNIGENRIRENLPRGVSVKQNKKYQFACHVILVDGRDIFRVQQDLSSNPMTNCVIATVKRTSNFLALNTALSTLDVEKLDVAWDDNRGLPDLRLDDLMLNMLKYNLHIQALNYRFQSEDKRFVMMKEDFLERNRLLSVCPPCPDRFWLKKSEDLTHLYTTIGVYLKKGGLDIDSGVFGNSRDFFWLYAIKNQRMRVLIDILEHVLIGTERKREAVAYFFEINSHLFPTLLTRLREHYENLPKGSSLDRQTGF